MMMKVLKVALLSDSSTQWLADEFTEQARDQGLEVHWLPTALYQIDSEIFNPTSVLFSGQPDYIIVYESSRNLLDRFRACPLQERGEFWKTALAHTRRQIENMRERTGARIFWCDAEDVAEGVFGAFASKIRQSADFQLKQYAAALWNLASEVDDLFIVPLSQLHARHGTSNVFDPRFHCMTGAALSLDYTPQLARTMLGMLRTLEGALGKCLILDLDNTMWGGVVGDVGAENVEVGELGLGRAYRDLQSWALELKKRGVILAVCSKNEAANARSPFLHRSEMVLKLDDFACFEANWQNKHENIARIREQLNIGYDSLVFVDDNPMERDIVRQFLPEVVVPELPEDPASYVDYLVSLDLFSVPQATAEDAARTAMYQSERKRAETQNEFASIGDYLASLEMRSHFQPVDAMSLKRTAQLFQKSNQFNLRTIRYSEEQVHQLLTDPNALVYSCKLRDKFGDSGLVSALILKVRGDELFFDNWVMSCRVFNRQLENFILEKCVELTRSLGKRALVGEYLPTAKNTVVSDLYPRLGFQARNEEWILEVADLTLAPTAISDETEMVENVHA